jgi:hypothetical protein
MTLRALTAIVSAFAVLDLAAPATTLAVAGSYAVPACTTAPGNVNHAWPATDNDTANISQGVGCPALMGSSVLQQQEQGLYTVDNLAAISGAIAGASAGDTFTAPTNTAITELSWTRYMGIHFDASWAVGLWVDGVLRPSDTCTADFGNNFECSVGGEYGELSSHETLQNLDAHQLFVGVQCSGGGCTSGASIHHVWASIYDATVTLSDSTPPTIGPFSGPLANGGDETGTQSLAFSVTDSTGIKALDVTLDGATVPGSPGAQSCDYTNPVPCPSLPTQTYTIDTTALSAGQHTIEVKAIDAAGLVSTSTQTFTVPSRPPATGASTNPISSPEPSSQGAQPTGQDAASGSGTPSDAKLRITRAQLVGHRLTLTAELPADYTGLMTFTVTIRHGRRPIRLRRTVRLARGVAHSVIVLDAIKWSGNELSLVVRYSGDRVHPAQTRTAIIRVRRTR